MPPTSRKRSSRKASAPDELQRIPGVGPSIAHDLRRLGFKTIQSLRKADPQRMYDRITQLDGVENDRCLLYVFRCAVYYAATEQHEPELLKWWSWSDGNLRAKSPAPGAAKKVRKVAR